MTVRTALLLFSCILTVSLSRASQPGRSIFAGHYTEGERMTYFMRGTNGKWRYRVRAAGVVKKDSNGGWVAEYTWSHLVSNGTPVTLPRSGERFRQIVSLTQSKPPSLPNLRDVPPALVGPITDLETFYVDLWLATRLGGKLGRAGDHVRLNLGVPASWADDHRVQLGESVVDFEIALLKINRPRDVATLLVKHVPPAQLRVRLPASWMRKRVGETPNNWVQVEKKAGKFVAGVGRETFDVQMKVNLVSGKILSGTMVNQVSGQERDCSDAALARCSDARPLEISRRIEISLQN